MVVMGQIRSLIYQAWMAQSRAVAVEERVNSTTKHSHGRTEAVEATVE